MHFWLLLYGNNVGGDVNSGVVEVLIGAGLYLFSQFDLKVSKSECTLQSIEYLFMFTYSYYNIISSCYALFCFHGVLNLDRILDDTDRDVPLDDDNRNIVIEPCSSTNQSLVWFSGFYSLMRV